MGKIWTWFSVIFLSIAVLIIAIFAIYPPARQWPADLIVRSDALDSKTAPTAIVLLMGDTSDRTPKAAELLNAGHGDLILFIESEFDSLQKLGLKQGNGEVTYRYLTEVLGISADKIHFDKGGASSTQEEARIIFEILKSRYPDVRKIVLTTSWYHSSRSAWIFNLVNSEGYWTIKNAPSKQPINWLAEERSFLAVYNEYLKWIYYYLNY